MTILIADDNPLIRNWMKIMLLQAEGDEVTLLEAADGNEAYDLCMHQHIDLLITDIRMPGRDGIELIKSLRTACPHTRFAVLTSYDDFAYVRMALKCGTLDYILKAEMQQEDISSLMSKVKESITLSTSSLSRMGTYHDDIQQARLKYTELSQGAVNETLSLIHACGLTAADFPVCCMLLYLEEHISDMEYAAQVCCNALRMEKCSGLFFPISGKSLLALYALPKDSAIPDAEAKLRLLSTIDQNLSFANAGKLRQNVTLALDTPEAFSAVLGQAKALIDYQSYYQTTAIPPEGIPPHSPKEGEFLQDLRNHLSDRNSGRTAMRLQEYITECHNRKEFPYRIRRAATTATQMMLNALTFCSSQTEAYLQLDQLTQELNDVSTAIGMQRLVERFCALHTKHFANVQKPISPAVSKAIAFCNEHYQEKISLERLANIAGFNKSYFSQLFHKETNMPFGDYLESIRIQNAQRLLRDLNLSISDIAEVVGFANQNYFTKVFKKQTGLVPSQYRRLLFQTQEEQEHKAKF